MLTRLLPLLCAAASFAAPGLTDQLSPYVDLQPQDSVVALHRIPGGLSVDLLQRQSKVSRSISLAVNQANLAKLLAQARTENVAVDSLAPVAAPVDTARRPAPVLGQGLNTSRRWDFVNYQSGISEAIYGWCLPLAFELDNSSSSPNTTTLIGLNLLTVPGSYFGHMAFSNGKEFGDAQFNGIHDYSVSMLVGAYGASYALLGPDLASFKAAAVATAIGYPFAVGLGYDYGTRYDDNPGRISLRSNLAFVGGATGVLTDMLFADEQQSAESATRILAIMATAGYFGGHFLADAWNPGGHVAGGVGDGIGQTALVGALAGTEAGAILDAKTYTSNVGLILGGVLAGTATGWEFFQGTPDTRERSAYTSLGMTGGLVGGIGLLFLSGEQDVTRTQVTSFLTIGPAVGYLAARALTSGMTEQVAAPKSSSVIRGSDFQLLPQLSMVRVGNSDVVHREWSVPGLVIHFM
jgi:hypothetical protein